MANKIYALEDLREGILPTYEQIRNDVGHDGYDEELEDVPTDDVLAVGLFNHAAGSVIEDVVDGKALIMLLEDGGPDSGQNHIRYWFAIMDLELANQASKMMEDGELEEVAELVNSNNHGMWFASHYFDSYDGIESESLQEYTPFRLQTQTILSYYTQGVTNE